jgi:hypothetical protein
MDERTSQRYQLIFAWCGPAFLITFLLFWGVIGHNIPNPAPSLTAEALKLRYLADLGEIRLGFIVSLITVCLYLPWSCLLAGQMAKIEGKNMPILSLLQLLGGGLTVMVVSFSATFWVVAAFRPEADASTFQLMTDTGWLCIDLQYSCTTLQMVAAALVGLSDKRATPLFPRWACFLTIWCAISFFPASMTGVLKTGPFAWNGMLSYYLPYFCWLCWFSTASIFMLKEVRRSILATATLAPTGNLSPAHAAFSNSVGVSRPS